jgi:hypothetical protein
VGGGLGGGESVTLREATKWVWQNATGYGTIIQSLATRLGSLKQALCVQCVRITNTSALMLSFPFLFVLLQQTLWNVGMVVTSMHIVTNILLCDRAGPTEPLTEG